MCRSRVLMGSSRRVRLSWNDTRVSRSPIVVELTLPILAHKPDAVLHQLPVRRRWLMLMYKRCNDLRRRVL